jgi:hypothetical protein
MKPNDRELWIELEDEYSDFLWDHVRRLKDSDVNGIPENLIENMTSSLYGI